MIPYEPIIRFYKIKHTEEIDYGEINYVSYVIFDHVQERVDEEVKLVFREIECISKNQEDTRS